VASSYYHYVDSSIGLLYGRIRLRRVHYGALLLGVAALFFALTTVFAKLVGQQSEVGGVASAFFRYLVGFVAITALAARKQVRPVPNSWTWTLLRALLNIAASVFFFLAVEFTTITNANLLNLTSPVFIFLLAPFMPGYQRRPGVDYLFLALTMIGAWLVVVPSFDQVNLGDLYGLASGVLGGIAITMLYQARRYDNAIVILFYQMGLGTLLTMAWGLTPDLMHASAEVWLLLFGVGVCGALAQFLLTEGYHFIDTQRGSIISSSQILFAAVMGVLLFGDPVTWRTSLGGLSILLSLVGISGVWRGRVKLFRRN
jgi:drug/metabolite transporter (DMT)-like permease